jgi:Na+/H+ antiporter NhaD/arsenite permease-like protein
MSPTVFSIPVDFLLFGFTLLGVALFHHHTLRVALTGLVVVVIYKLLFTGFAEGPGINGLLTHLAHEWVILANLFGLLVGFAFLSRHFELSKVPELLPRFLPDDWKGCFMLLVSVFVLSSFLDNIAAAMIGGTVAASVFRKRVHIGYLAAIVAAANAGGAGSVIGDTTTTMMWIDGVSPLDVLHAFIPAFVALLVFGIPASLQQQRCSPIVVDSPRHVAIDWPRVLIVLAILIAAIGVNVGVNLHAPEAADKFPFLGATVWTVLLALSPWRAPDWQILPATALGSIFLLSLVLIASMMPVASLPAPGVATTFALGFISAIFDNIPLTKLALVQGGYDWGFLAYAVGFGGSMLWFGSSAGVAITNLFPEGKSAFAWLRGGWHVALGYVAGFFVLWLVLGWNPHAA